MSDSECFERFFSSVFCRSCDTLKNKLVLVGNMIERLEEIKEDMLEYQAEVDEQCNEDASTSKVDCNEDASTSKVD
jgi:hypothetical protein